MNLSSLSFFCYTIKIYNFTICTLEKIKIQGKSSDVANDPVAKEFYLGKDFKL